MTIYFTADTHFYHQNVIKYCNRPWKYADEMNEGLIKNWNDTVGDNDHVYHLGDFSFANADKTEAIACRLKGKKYLIRGNHDHRKVVDRIAPYFEWIKDVYQLTVQDKEHPHGKQLIWLAHYAHRVWPQQSYGSWCFYGHSHGALANDLERGTVDVGVDCWDYRPVSYEQLKKIIIVK